ncbi:hypothetical protein SLEP1_g34354 [Rubroshorea leprosula]|uniref:Secreted protein n=1 Tax=Rubroshorea leprosula TaxID=152421 RepID=A0AAV5KJS3_9ROSI|nr:hypothetical protein SLEP1_g34354 [Rubroshorea leprosula]
MSAHVDMLLVTLLVGEVINASTCRHVIDRTGLLSNPASGGYTPANRVPASGRFITLAVTYRGDVYFVPVLYPFCVIAHVGML